MNSSLDFNQTLQQQWLFWGMQFNFVFPGSVNQMDMKPSISTAPGQEPLSFYETALDLGTGKYYSLNSLPELGKYKFSLADIGPLKNRSVHFSRLRFNHCWPVCYGSSQDFFNLEIWIHKVQKGKDLLIPQHLQEAHINYLSKVWVTDSLEDAHWHALDWRAQETNKFFLQSYTEISGESYAETIEEEDYSGIIMAENYLLPLGSEHYMWLRFHRSSVNYYRDAKADFEKLVQFVMQHFSFQLSPEASEAIKAEPVLKLVDFSQQMSTKEKNEWKVFDQLLREKRFLSSAVAQTPAASASPATKSAYAALVESLFLYIVLLLLLVIAPLLLLGIVYATDWAKEHPDSIWASAHYLFFVVQFILIFRKNINNMAERYFSGKRY